MYNELVIICLVMTLAAAVQATVGFGFGLLSLAVLGSVIGVKEASIILVLAHLCLNAIVFWKLRTHFTFKM